MDPPEVWESLRIDKDDKMIITAPSESMNPVAALIKQQKAKRTEDDEAKLEEEGRSVSSMQLKSAAGTDEIVLSVRGRELRLQQQPGEAIGCYLWPSSVIMSRHLITQSAAGCFPRSARVLELGSGIGVVAVACLHLGWHVVATDKPEVVELLQRNSQQAARAIAEEQGHETDGSIQVLPYTWGDDCSELIEAGEPQGTKEAGVKEGGYDIVVCADCLYAQASVKPLLAALLALCERNRSAVVLIANELRSALDSFLQKARDYFDIEHIRLSEAQMHLTAASSEVEAAPKPIGMRRLTFKRANA